MIPLAGTFDYQFVLKRSESRGEEKWSGKGLSRRDSTLHPGPFGYQPDLEVHHDLITIHSTESMLSWLKNKHFREWGAPIKSASYQVGDALSCVIQDGDTLYFHRSGTGDRGITLLRNEKLVLAFGAIIGMQLGDEISIKDDPRLKEILFYEIAAYIKLPGTKIAWIDPSQGGLQACKNLIQSVPSEAHLIVAVKETSGDPSLPQGLDEQISSMKSGSLAIVSVDSKYADERMWVEYLRSLPAEVPKDFRVKVTIQEKEVHLREGAEEFIGPYYVCVERAYRVGVPGEESILGVARLSENVTKEIIIKSVKAISN